MFDFVEKRRLFLIIPSAFIVLGLILYFTMGLNLGADFEYGASIARAVSAAAILAFVYLWIRFDFRSGISALVGLLYNVLLIISVYSVFRIPVGATFFAAVLASACYTIGDIIISFGRVRENRRSDKRSKFTSIVNKCINEGLIRTFLSLGITLLILVIFLILGIWSVRGFAFCAIIGVLTGTYSTIFIASPIMAVLNKNKKAKV